MKSSGYFIRRRMMMPSLLILAHVSKKNRNSILASYIRINNRIAISGKKRFQPEKVLVLLPHCLQNSLCVQNITNSARNCMRCMKCNIGQILEISEACGVLSTVVVDGGHLARSIIQEIQPEFIIAVACAMELAMGISDIRMVPVFGLSIIRTNGPCKDTRIDMEALCETLKYIIDVPHDQTIKCGLMHEEISPT